MNNLIRKKVILCLLDSDPKSADEIAGEIGESSATVADQLTVLVSESICEGVSPDEVSQYVVRKDIEAFAKLVKDFLSNPEEHNREAELFISSEYYLTRIDYELVDYVLSRFHLGSVYGTNEMKKVLGRILLASPSALIFALYDDTTFFDGMSSSRHQLDPSNTDRDWINGILYFVFQKRLLEKLIADTENPTYGILLAKLQLQAAKISIQVNLATPHEKYIEAIAEGSFVVSKAMEDLPAGQPVSAVNPIALSNNGLAFMHLGEFETALEQFDKTLNAVTDPIQKAFVLNNKGVVFFRFGQYQKAIECFEEGIALDSGSEVPLLLENKQMAEEYLTRAADADNLTEPTQIRFVQGYPIPFEETLFYEFKEIKGGNPARSITKDSDEYAVAFLNREGGRIFWGVRDSNRTTIGVILNEQQRNEARTKVSEKLGAIQPSISVEDWQLEFHNVYGLQGETVEDLWVIELVISPPQERDVFYTGSSDLFVKTEGGRQKLRGQQITEFILRRLQADTETD